MERKQFTFYRSFWDAMQSLPKRDQLPFVTAMCAYALDGEERPLSGPAASSFSLVKPVLDTARRKAENGKHGGSKSKAKQKQTESTEEANGKQTEREKEKEIEIEKELEIENECLYIPPSDDDTPLSRDGGVVGVVVRAVGEIGPKGRAELSGFVDSMGEDCVLKALEAAQDAGKPTWAYVRGALRNKRDQGVTSAEQWDRAEARFQGAKGRASGPGVSFQPSVERIQKNSDWLEQFLAEQEGCE